MNQQEARSFLCFAVGTLGATWIACDESDHCYHNEEFIGGFAGDCREYFVEYSEYTKKLIRMMDTFNAEPDMSDMGDIDASDCP